MSGELLPKYIDLFEPVENQTENSNWKCTRAGRHSFSATRVAITKVAKKKSLKLIAKDAINNKVDGGINRNEQIADASHFIHKKVGNLKDVHHHSQNVENKKYCYYTEEHRC